MKPKVVILSAFLRPHRSGAEACVEEIAQRLADTYDITIVTTQWQKDLPKYDVLEGKVPVVRVGFGNTFDKWLFPFLAPFAVRKLKPELIHTVLESYASIAMIICSWIMPNTKRLLTCQSTNTSLLLKPIHKNPHAITGISFVLQERAKKLGRDDLIIIPNGLTVSAFEEGRKKYEKVPGRIVFIGRLRPMKGVDILLPAFRTLIDMPDAPENVHLHLVGEGFQEQELKQLAEKLQLGDRAVFLGYLPLEGTIREFCEAEVFCCLSRHEAFGNVFVEAQSAGCAVIGTDCEAIPSLIEDGVSGLIVPIDDADAAAEALRKLVTGYGLRVQLSKAGIENAKKYDWDPIAKRYAQVYESLLSRTS